MNRIVRSTIAGLLVGVLAAAGSSAFVGSESDPQVSLRISPKHLLTSKTLDSAEPFEMTLHVQGAPSTTYDFEVVSDGTAGTCPEAPATLTTNPQGKVVWTCEFATAEGPGEGTVTFTVYEDEVPVTLVATIVVREPSEDDEVESEELEAEDEESEGADNHGQCVSYWTKRAKEEGLVKWYKGQFTSMVAQSDCTGVDPEEFADELAEALAAQEEELGAEASQKPAKDKGGAARSSGKVKSKD